MAYTSWIETRLDEYAPDSGCEAGGPSCVHCPLPRCVEDITKDELAAERSELHRRIAARHRELAQHPNPRVLVAAEFGVSVRTVSRAVKEA